MKEQIEAFFKRPGINKSGICAEAGITQQYLNRILRGTQPITDSFLFKITPVLKSYGFDAGGKRSECSHEKTTKHAITGIRYCSNPKCKKIIGIE